VPLDDQLYTTDDIEKAIAIPIVQELHMSRKHTTSSDFTTC